LKSLYIDTSNSGISGDMFLAGLINLVENPNEILKKLRNLKNYLPRVSTFEVNLIQTDRSGIKVSQLDINIKEDKHSRSSKSLLEALNRYLSEYDFSKEAIEYANKVLGDLINAEAVVHEKLAEEIHLHELSSIDTLLDVIGTTMILEDIGYFKNEITISTSTLPLGGGVVNTAHGILPVPAPATTKILEKSKLISKPGPIDYELVTPTGIALLNSLNPRTEIWKMRVEKVVQSTGEKNFKDFPNILRIFYGFIEKNQMREDLSFLDDYIQEIAIIETDVDDVSGEIIGNLMRILEKKNVLDIQVIPSMTKKQRTSNIVRVLCEPKIKTEIIDIFLRELGTLGVRFQTMQRVCVERFLKRESIEIEKEKYMITFKISFYKSSQKYHIINIKPEFEDLKKISEKTGLPVKIIEFYAQEKLVTLRNEFLSKKNKKN
jgi:uncharacterized protein (TIGR00299 family) protein